MITFQKLKNYIYFSLFIFVLTLSVAQNTANPEMMMLSPKNIKKNSYVFPINLTDYQQEKLNKVPVDIIKDADNIFKWTLANGLSQTITIDPEKIGVNLKEYDEFRFDILPESALTDLQMKIKGYPSDNETSSWYMKTRAVRDRWNGCRFDLHTDDDGFWFKSDKSLKNIIEFTLVKRSEGILGEPNGRIAKIANPRFVKNRLSVSFNHMGAIIDEGTNVISYTYELKVKNCTDRPVMARLNADSCQTLKYFAVNAPSTLSLAANETKLVPIRLYIYRNTAMTLPPLYAERIFPVVEIEGISDSDVTPLMGYRRWPMWAVVPIFNRFWWTPATMQAHLEARKTLTPDLENWKSNIMRRADNALSVDWVIPPADLLPPGYIMSYTCPKCGSNNMKLAEPTSFNRHICMQCKNVVEDNPNLNRAGIWAYMANRFEDIRALSLAWLITGDEKYAGKACEIFILYADAYQKFPVSRLSSTAGGSRLNTTTLYSSYFLTPLAEGYAYLHESKSIDAETRKKIENFLLSESGQISRHCVYDSNMTAEHFRAYGTVGIDTGYWPLLGEAIYGEFGWHEVVDHGFSDDGIAHEAGAYHKSIFYALMNFAMFASEQGVNLLTARTKRIFDASLNVDVANGDWWPLAYQVYRDPAYLKMIKGAGVFHGLIGMPKADVVPVSSQVLPGAGYIYLRKGTVKENREIRMNYINTFDRNENDKFQTVFFRNGIQIDGAVGRINYSHPKSKWMEDTAAHNAIVVDGADQLSVNGRLLAVNFSSDSPVAVIETLPDAPLYTGVQQIRGIAVLDDFYIVFDRITLDKSHVIDRYQYGPGVATCSVPMTKVEVPDNLPAAGSFTDLVGGVAGKIVDIDYSGKLRMRLISNENISAYKAKTVGSWLGNSIETTFVRSLSNKPVTFFAAFTDDKTIELPVMQIDESNEKLLAFTLKTLNKGYRITLNQVTRTVVVSEIKKGD